MSDDAPREAPRAGAPRYSSPFLIAASMS
jgi:hypothetical protein